MSDVARWLNFPFGPLCYRRDISAPFSSEWKFRRGEQTFNGKHEQYGYKMKVFVLPYGLDTSCIEHEFGLVSDLPLFERMQYFQKEQLQKKG